jgi:sulfite exporter TauE/SafE
MLSFGIGTAAVLLAAGLASLKLLGRLRPQVLARAGAGKRGLGIMLLFLGLLVLSGGDKRLEAWAIGWLPEWSTSL